MTPMLWAPLLKDCKICHEIEALTKCLHALMLVHVHINIQDNINLADVANQFVNRKESRKETFKHFSHDYS